MNQRVSEAAYYFSSIKGARALIITHRNADPDAIGCAYVLQSISTTLGFEAEVCLPEGPDRLSKRILNSLRVPWQEDCDTADLLVICDTSNKMMLGGAASLIDKAKEIIIIDHHSPPGNLISKASYSLIIGEPSATVIAVLLADALKVRLTKEISTIALSGILYDTRRYLSTTPNTFLASKILLEEEGDYDMALKLLEFPEDRSEIIAKLKGVQRASILDICGYLVAVTEASAHEAAVAKALVSLGVDLAIVAGGHEFSRTSIRVSNRLLEKGFDSSKLVADVATSLEAEAGGHPGASGISIYKRGIKPNIIRNESLRRLLWHSVELLNEICRKEALGL
ncbi:hypothetical protein MA03_05985 [Infirmifilum uzonense]|uniref:DDH domain-containing protein n=1 Tax=Infirmifilum uzonense TaxID=1550241 RepID=A0A0F7FI81_9CREN|nr:DHH family phosphoesterase [Infirmifilum uzonense]AKG38892.1 hypothetical protein MA03_05985 [Infirmifilum uzonense]